MLNPFITINGSQGEGGGQILRTSLALSLVTGKAFRIERIRAGRERPGLLRQHLTAVKAAASVGAAEVSGANLGSQELTFVPHEEGAAALTGGDYHFVVGTAGSATLVFQTVFPALALAGGASTVVIEGGTHNPHAPPFDFLVKAFLPLMKRMGINVSAELERPGFYPAGGGSIRVRVEPANGFQRLDITERGSIVRRRARAVVANLHRSIAEREIEIIKRKLNWNDEWLIVDSLYDSKGPGNFISIELECEYVTEVFTGFGERGVLAETIAGRVVNEARSYLAVEAAATGGHLADQLLLPMALAGGGSFTTLPLSPHATTNMDVIKKFLAVEIETSALANRAYKVELST